MPGPMGLSDGEFWSAPARTQDAVIERLAEEAFQGVLLDGPRQVALERKTLPLLGVIGQSLRDSARWDWNSFGLLMGVRLDSRRVVIAPTQQKNVPEDETTDPPDEDPGEGFTYGNIRLDGKKLLSLPWREGSWSFRLLVRDRCSGPVVSELGAVLAEPDPEVEKFLREQRPPRYPQPVAPKAGKPFPAYGDEAGAPPAAKPGIELKAERVVVLRKDATCPVRGSFKLKLGEREMVRAKQAKGKPPPPELSMDEAKAAGYVWQDPGDPKATAVVPITIVITGSEARGPWIVELQVPVYSKLDPKKPPEEQEVTGAFAFDLLAQKDRPKTAQTVWLYASCGEVFAGPITIGLVDPARLASPD